MELDANNLKIVLILTFGFGYAALFGYIFNRLGISVILGYLLAGYLIGPYSPGFVADLKVAEQLAEIGVILMMFEIGMHFKFDDLWRVKNITISGALIQSAITALVGSLLFYAAGWSVEASVIIGLSIAIASTVVLVRMLTDNDLLKTNEGAISIGWLIVEDFIAIAVILFLPWLSESTEVVEWSWLSLLVSFIIFVLKFTVLLVFMFTIGKKCINYVLMQLADPKLHELFTVAILALTFVVAATASYYFGTSMALGAFIAGMLIGQTNIRKQALLNSLPMKDTFIVIFFVTVGMLFNPEAIVTHFWGFLAILGVVLIVKPLSAFLIVYLARHPIKTALTVAVALAQIGEFSFIIAEYGLNLDILPDAGFDIIVATAIVSISLNPFLFRMLPK